MEINQKQSAIKLPHGMYSQIAKEADVTAEYVRFVASGKDTGKTDKQKKVRKLIAHYDAVFNKKKVKINSQLRIPLSK